MRRAIQIFFELTEKLIAADVDYLCQQNDIQWFRNVFFNIIQQTQKFVVRRNLTQPRNRRRTDLRRSQCLCSKLGQAVITKQPVFRCMLKPTAGITDEIFKTLSAVPPLENSRNCTPFFIDTETECRTLVGRLTRCIANRPVSGNVPENRPPGKTPDLAVFFKKKFACRKHLHQFRTVRDHDRTDRKISGIARIEITDAVCSSYVIKHTHCYKI